MTALVLSAAGAALGAAAGPLGAIAGRLAGAALGATLDQRLFGRSGARNVEGPRLSDLDVQASSEGAPIPQVYGRARISGQIVWATRFEEVATTTRQDGGGKGAPRPAGSTTNYSYFANFAVALCEGEIAHVGRVWADGKPLDLQTVTMRVHRGGETQAPDPLIEAKQGAEGTPAYRGTATVVFERLALAPFGNRIPQLAFEVVRPIGRLERQVRAVCVIPGATEFGYGTTAVARDAGLGAGAPENRNTGATGTDFTASLSELLRLCPNLDKVALVVGWFGDDLRAGVCKIRPGVDLAAKATSVEWRAGGIGRADAHEVSRIDGRAVYGGTPSDASVLEAIAWLKGRGIAVTLIPFLFMDIAPGNGRPDPWTGAADQPALPWRGRITSSIAPGRPGTPDGTAAVSAEVSAFFGAAAPADFAAAGGEVTYGGPQEWSYRRFVLHNAKLAALAGVDCFLIGSEMVGLTRLRSDRRSFPAAEALAALAADVKAMLGPSALVTYGADWTEYGGYVPPGTSDLVFPLDRLWASPAVGRVGVDWYPPLGDWRDGDAHADAGLAERGTERGYLAARVTGGEAFDWHYTDEASRAAQIRTPITDGAYGKPWVHRPKDLAGWWTSSHVERLDGVEVGATDWVPASKPVRFTELGVPAVDKGANQPNLFPDPRSSENGRPEGSDGARDEAGQRRALEVLLDAFDPATPEGAARNPLVGGVRMVEHDATHLWCWDVRPWPAFPALGEVWGDGPNWRTGHWLNGRLGAAPVGELASALSARFGGPPIEHDDVAEVAAGYVVERPMTGRAALEPLAAAFGLDLVARGASLELKPRARRPVVTLDGGELARVEGEDQPRLVRAQESELPREVAFTVSDAEREFRRVVVSARRATGAAERESRSDFALVMPAETAEAHAALALRRAWAARETASFALPPSRLALEPGDLVTLDGRPLRLVRVVDGAARAVEAEGDDPGLARPATGPLRPPVVVPPPFAGRPYALVLDLPALPGDEAPHRPKLAVAAEPWPGGQILWRARAGGYEPALTIERRATLGLTLDALPAGPVWRFDRSATVRVRLTSGALASVSEEAVLDGANAFALRHPSGAWEVLQAAGAELVGERTYRLSTLLRGQAGTEALAAAAVPAGASIVLVDGALAALPVEPDDIGRALAWRLAPPGFSHDAPEALAFTMTPGGVGLQPLAPAHPKARRIAGGVELTFIRRTRQGGDGWELAEVALGEERERYLVEVLAAGAPVRAFDVAEPRVLYAAADELADFGSAQASLGLRVRQCSSAVGPGRPLEAVVAVLN